jgi:hypothetical protein
LARSAVVSCSGWAASIFAVLSGVFSMARRVSLSAVQYWLRAWNTKVPKAAGKKVHRNAIMAKGNSFRTTNRVLF